MPIDRTQFEEQYGVPTQSSTSSIHPDTNYKSVTESKFDNIASAKAEKTARLAPQDANTMSPMDLQEYIGSQIASETVYNDREDGTLYQMKQNSDGSWREEDYYGKTSYLYADESVDGGRKYGLASQGFDKRYTPDGSGYGWKPGDRGVNVADGKMLDVLLPKTVAEDLEYTIHSNKGQIENRQGGNKWSDYRRMRDNSQLGSGASEYTTTEAPMWNVDYQGSEDMLAKDTMMPMMQKQDVRALRMAELNKALRVGESDGEGGFGNALSGFASTVVTGLENTADLPAELVQWAGNKTGIGILSSDGEGFVSPNAGKENDELFGYDRSITEAKHKEVAAAFDKAWDKGEYGDLVAASWEALKTPEQLAEVGGFLVQLILPGKLGQYALRVATGVTKAAQAEMAIAKAAGTEITMAQATDKVLGGSSTATRLLHIGAGKAGYVNYAEQGTREAEAEYKEMYGEEMSSTRRAATWGLYYASGRLDGMTDTAILAGKDAATVILRKMFGEASKKAQVRFVKAAVKNTGKKAAEVVGAMIVEGGTEIAQEMVETVATQLKYDDDKGLSSTAEQVGDIVTDRENITKFGTSGVLGAVGGTHFKAVGLGKDAITGVSESGIKDKLSDIQKKRKEKIAKEEEEADVEAVDTDGVEVDGISKLDVASIKPEDIETQVTVTKATYDAVNEDSAPDDVIMAVDNYLDVLEKKNGTDEIQEKLNDPVFEKKYLEEVGIIFEEAYDARDAAIEAMGAELKKASEENKKGKKGPIKKIQVRLNKMDTMTAGKVIGSAGISMHKQATEDGGFEFELPDDAKESMKKKGTYEQYKKATKKGYYGRNTKKNSNNKYVKANTTKKIKEEIKAVKNVVTKKEEITSETDETDTHTEGFTVRTIKALAKEAGVSAERMQQTLNSAFGKVKIKKMDVVSKAANDYQRDLYYGKDGINKSFARYRGALERGHDKVALREVSKIQEHGYKQERKLNRYAVKYDEMVGLINERVAEAKEFASETGADESTVVADAIKNIAGKYTITDSKFKITAVDVANDVELAAEVREKLGFEEGSVSKAKELMVSMVESIEYIDTALDSIGQDRKYDVGTVVDIESDATKYKKTIAEVNSEIAKIEAMGEKRGGMNGLLLDMKAKAVKRLEDLEAGIVRVGKAIDNRDSRKRFVSNDNSERIEKVKARLAELKGKRKPELVEERGRLETKLSEYLDDEATLASIEANMNKKVGSEVVGKGEHKSLATESSIIELIRSDKEAKVEIEDGKIEKVDEKFVAGETSENKQKKMVELKDAKEEVSKIAVQVERIRKLTTKTGKRVVDVVGDEDMRVYTGAKETLRTIDKHITELRAQLASKVKEKQDAAIKADAILARKAGELVVAEGELDATVAKMNKQLGAMHDNMSPEEIAGTKSEVKKTENVLRGLAKKALGWMKGTRQLLYKFIQKEEGSELNNQIEKLTKELRKAEWKAKKAGEVVEKVETKAGKEVTEIQEAAKRIGKLNAMRDKLIGSDGKMRKVKTKIQELISTMSDGALVNSWLMDGPGKTKDGESRGTLKVDEGKEVSEAQVLDLAEVIEAKKGKSVIGSISVDEMTVMMDKDTGKAFKKQFTEAKQAIARVLVQDRDSNGYMSNIQLSDSPMSGLLFSKVYRKDKDQVLDSVNDNMVVAMMLVANGWAQRNGTSNLHNTKDDVARMLGLLDGSQVSPEQYKMLKDMGSFQKVVVHGLGNDLFNVMGIQEKEDVTGDMNDKIRGDAGGLVLAYMKEIGLVADMTKTVTKGGKTVRPGHISRAVWDKAMADTGAGADNKDGATIPMVQSVKAAMPMYIAAGKLIDGVDEALSLGLDKKSYLVERNRGSDEYYTKVKGSPFDVPKKSQETYKKVEAEEYGIIDGVVSRLLKIYGSVDGYKKAMGYKTEEEMTQMKESMQYTYDQIDTQMGHNREIETSIESLVDMQNKTDKGEIPTGVWFKWFFSKNGRFMLDSVGINPQTDKTLHRWSIIPKAAQDKLWSKDAEDWVYFQQGVAQAFGFGIDKKLTTKASKFADTVMEMKVTELEKAIASGELEIDGEVYEIEEPGHAIQALLAVERYQASKGGKFRATMTSEYDSVTSGFANKLLQTPVVGDLWKWLGKAGIFKADDKSIVGLGMNDYIDEGSNPDVYRSLAVDVNDMGDMLTDPDYGDDERAGGTRKAMMDSMKAGWKSVDGDAPIHKMVVEDTVTSWARNLFKNPFMIFNYGASIFNIRKSLGNKLASNVLEGILKGRYSTDVNGVATKINPEAVVFLQGLGINTVAELNKFRVELVEKDAMDIWVNSTNPQRKISEMFNDTFGAAVEKSMNKSFGELTKVNDSMILATKVMFNAFIGELKLAVDEKQAEKGRTLTENETLEIVRSLESVFPLIKAPNSSKRSDGVAIINKGVINYEKVGLKAGSVHLLNAKGKPAQIVIQNMIREFKEAQAAGAVLPIHWIDGTIIGEELAKGGLIGVHDAIVVGDDFEDRIKGMNEATFNTGREYNLVDSMMSALLETIETMEANGRLDQLGIVELKKNKLTPSEVVQMMVESIGKVEKGRAELYGKDGNRAITVMNIAGVKGSEYTSSVGSRPKYEDAIIQLQDKISKADYEAVISKVQDKVTEEGC